MSRFCLSRKLISGLSLFSLLVGGTPLVTPSASYADTSWMELLKPLVKEVIVPGAEAGMKRLLEKKLKLKLDSSDNTSETADTYNMDNMMSMPEEPTAASTPWDNNGDMMSMPEEPMSASTTSDGSGDMMSMPEEPVSSSSATIADATSSELAAPPPPVETP